MSEEKKYNLYKYCLDVIERLDSCPNTEYGKLFVKEKGDFFEIFQRKPKFKECLIFSSSHGIDFFKNIIKYWNNPDNYKEIERDEKGKTKGDTKYEDNFIRLIKENKNG